MPPIITLTTDFGHTDNYVGSLHGAILGINPSATIVDITHEIPSFNIAQGAYQLGTCYFLYPTGTIHVAVVDPGVGSKRLPLLIQTDNYLFIGPDNGLFSMMTQKENVRAIFELTNRRLFLPQISSTFHGRDIFTPVAAHLSLGVSPDIVGPKRKDFLKLHLFEPQVGKQEMKGSIINIDKFGNAITNITKEIFMQHIGAKPFELRIAGKKVRELSVTYSEVLTGKPALLFGSSDYLELALYQDSIAKKWRLKAGQKFSIKIG